MAPSDLHPSISASSRFSRVRKRLLRPLRELAAGARALHPAKLVFLGYVWYIAAGWLLLSLPYAPKGKGAGALDSLFIAASAVSTTGLVTVSIADSYTFLGQAVILVLIQLGGIGYMTVGSFLILSRRAELPALHSEVGRAVFSLPVSFRLDKFIRSVVRFTLAIELLGAAALYVLFRRVGVEGPLWSAVSSMPSSGAFASSHSRTRMSGQNGSAASRTAWWTCSTPGERSSRTTGMPGSPCSTRSTS